MEDRSFPASANTGDPNGPLRPVRNEIAGALISMMARKPNKLQQRPDTLMQDRSPPTRRKPLATTAGPYIGSKLRRGGRANKCPGKDPEPDSRWPNWFVAYGQKTGSSKTPTTYRPLLWQPRLA